MSTYPIFGITGYATSGKGTVSHHLCTKYGYTHLSLGTALRELVAEINPIVDITPVVHSSVSNTSNTTANTKDSASNVVSPSYLEQNGIVRYNDVVKQYGYTEAKRLVPEVRKVLVALGTGARKHIHPDVWLDRVLPKNYNGSRLVVLDDVRHVNEVKRIKELNGFVIRVDRQNVGPANEVEKASIDEIGPDFRISNDGSILELTNKVDYLMHNHFPQYRIKSIN